MNITKHYVIFCLIFYWARQAKWKCKENQLTKMTKKTKFVMSRAYLTKVCTGLSAKCRFHSWIATGHNLSRTNLCAVWSNKKNGQAGWHISRRISKASCSTGYPRKQDKKDFTKDKKQTKDTFQNDLVKVFLKLPLDL